MSCTRDPKAGRVCTCSGWGAGHTPAPLTGITLMVCLDLTADPGLLRDGSAVQRVVVAEHLGADVCRDVGVDIDLNARDDDGHERHHLPVGQLQSRLRLDLLEAEDLLLWEHDSLLRSSVLRDGEGAQLPLPAQATVTTPPLGRCRSTSISFRPQSAPAGDDRVDPCWPAKVSHREGVDNRVTP